MDRRSVLAALSAGTSSLAGCLSGNRFLGNDNSCTENGSVSFEPTSDEFIVVTGDNTVEALVFTLQNETPCQLTLNPEAWRIERKSGDNWKQIASGSGEEQVTISRGGEYRWSLSLSQHPTPLTESKSFLFVDLSEGTYALVVTGELDDGEQITRRAQFDLTIRTPKETTTDT